MFGVHRSAASLSEPASQPTRDAGRRWRCPRLTWSWLVVCCYVIGAVALTAHLWVDPAGREQLSGSRDVNLFAWFLSYAATAVAHGHLPSLVTVALNAPQGVNMMWNASFLLPGVLLTPLTLLAGPQASVNLALAIGFAGSAASLFWVLRRWGASVSAAALGGAVYGFSPALLNAGVSHYHLQFVVLPPLIIDAVLRLITGRRRSIWVGGWLGLLAAAQLLTGEEILVYTAVACLILTTVIAASYPREVPKRVCSAATGLAVALAVFLVAAGRALWVQFFGPLAEHSKLGASRVLDPSWFVTPSAELLFHTRASAAVTPPVVNAKTEGLSYLGWPLICVLVIAAVVFRRDVRVRAAAVAWAVMELFALGGGNMTVGGFSLSGRLLPWHWLQGPSWPGPGAAVALLHPRRRRGCRGARVLARWGTRGGVAGRGLAALATRNPHRGRPARGIAAGAAALPVRGGPASPGRLAGDSYQIATPARRAGAHPPVSLR